MRTFKIPYGKILPDKIIYGKFTIKEAIYIASICLVFAYLFILDTAYIENGIETSQKILKLMTLIIYSILAIIMAFKKIDIYDLDEYILLKIKYKITKKRIIYEKY